MSSFSFFPEQAGTFSERVDNLYIFMLWVSAFFTVLVVALVVALSIKYRKRDGKMPEAVHGNLLLEIVWTGIPLLLTLGMFAWSTYIYVQEIHIPANATEIFVVGKQWMWKIQHGEGPREMNELHVPINTPIKLTITSEDVLHSFFVPAFRAKVDAVPGRYTFSWFKAVKAGKFHLFCAEYCGTRHSEMIGSIYVMSQPDYDKWLAERIANVNTSITVATEKTDSVNTSVIANGQKLFQDLKCVSCHSATSGAMGPNLSRLYGSTVVLDSSPTVKADETYIRESILSPSEKITKGYAALMPTYKGQVNEEQILSLVTYIKSLKSNQE